LGGSEKEKHPGEGLQPEDEPVIPKSMSGGGTTILPEIGSPVSEVMHTAPTSPDGHAGLDIRNQAELLETASLGVERGDEATAGGEVTGTAL
jgi:hypothetical protein